jgi:hypothetical protein
MDKLPTLPVQPQETRELGRLGRLGTCDLIDGYESGKEAAFEIPLYIHEFIHTLENEERGDEKKGI